MNKDHTIYLRILTQLILIGIGYYYKELSALA